MQKKKKEKKKAFSFSFLPVLFVFVGFRLFVCIEVAWIIHLKTSRILDLTQPCEAFVSP